VPVFTYTALDSTGGEATGRVLAEGRAAALRQVAAQGLQPVSVEEKREEPVAGGTPRSWSRHVSRAAIDAFTRELANLLAAGVSLSRALHILGREASSGAAKRQWAAIYEDVVGGTSLADSLARWPRTFPPVYVAMVRAGEAGGFLDVVLEQIADFREREQDLKGRVKAAFVYPIVLAVLAVAVLVFLLTYFIPRFSGIFAEFGAALPALTRAIVKASEVVTDYGLILAVAAALAVLGLRRVLASEAGRRALEGLLLRVPGVGTAVARFAVARFALVRFCRMLGALVGAGVPLVSALRVAREAIGNQILADAVTHAVDQVQRGAPLAASLASAERLFPPSVIEMVAVAEESSRLDTELVRLAATYEAELDRRLRMLVAMAEPALLFVMAGVIGTVVIGMLLPVARRAGPRRDTHGGRGLMAHRRTARASRRAFTLVEALATLVLVAVILPVAMRGISLGSAAASHARRRVEAVALAELKLADLVATDGWQDADLSGDFGDDYPDYTWAAAAAEREEATLRQLDGHVFWTARGAERSVALSTLVYVEAE